MVKPVPPALRLGLSLIGLSLVFSGCAHGGAAKSGRRAPENIIVGSFAFSESRVLGEIYTQALAARGLPVQQATGLGSREQVEPALEQGAVDVLPEYAGTALRFLSGDTMDAADNLEAVHRRLQDAFAARGVVVLQPARAQDQNGVAVTTGKATELGVRKVSDLWPIAGRLVFGGPPECPERPFCLVGLRSVYGLSFKAFRPLDSSGPETIAALEGNEVDVAVVFTTSAALSTGSIVLLQDDRRLQPPDNIVPVVRADVIRRHGEVGPILDSISAQLDTDELIRLNRSVEIDRQEPAAVARRWLADHDLVPK